MKRLFDWVASGVGLLLSSPVTVPVAIAVYFQDFCSPFYVAPRMGKGETPFKMVKLRSMVVNADQSGVDSTSAGDRRITGVGRFIRKFKLDELTQLWNVFKGDMSLVGPRPNVKRETDLYTATEKKLLSVRPGITDLASIVFADEGEILKGVPDPDLTYNQLIRPGKSRLGLLYIEKQSFWLDVRILFLTLETIVSRRSALNKTAALIESLGGDPDLVQLARRVERLQPAPPPGALEIVTSRG